MYKETLKTPQLYLSEPGSHIETRDGFRYMLERIAYEPGTERVRWKKQMPLTERKQAILPGAPLWVQLGNNGGFDVGIDETFKGEVTLEQIDKDKHYYFTLSPESKALHFIFTRPWHMA